MAKILVILRASGKQAERNKVEIEVWKSSFSKNRRIENILSILRIIHTNLTNSYLMEGGTNPPVGQVQCVHSCHTHSGGMPNILSANTENTIGTLAW